MGRYLREQQTLLGSLLKWLLLGAAAGLLSGSASALFLWSLDLATRTRQSHLYLIWLLPVGGLVVGLLYSKFGQDVVGGNNQVLEQLHENNRPIPLKMAPFVLGGTLTTHLFGGSAGREGTAVQMGASLADGLARLLRLKPADRRLLLTSGVAGGFGSCFGTPLAGTIFGLEVAQVGGVRYDGLVAALSASFVGDMTTRLWGVPHLHFPAIGGVVLDSLLLGKVALVGLAAGLVARAFAELTHGVKAIFRRAIAREWLRPVAGGLLIALLVIGLGAYDYAGIGTHVIRAAFEPGAVAALAFLWKLLLTALTLGAGFQGGEVTPLFFMGATLGATLAGPLGLPHELAVGAGFVAVFAGAANTPLACIIMAVEMFGGGAMAYFGVACIVAYIVSGHGGIYHAQRVLIPKSKSLPVPARATLAQLRQPEKRG